MTVRIDNVFRGGIRQCTDVDDAITFNGDIGRVARIAGAIGHPATADQDVEQP